MMPVKAVSRRYGMAMTVGVGAGVAAATDTVAAGVEVEMGTVAAGVGAGAGVGIAQKVGTGIEGAEADLRPDTETAVRGHALQGLGPGRGTELENPLLKSTPSIPAMTAPSPTLVTKVANSALGTRSTACAYAEHEAPRPDRPLHGEA